MVELLGDFRRDAEKSLLAFVVVSSCKLGAAASGGEGEFIIL